MCSDCGGPPKAEREAKLHYQGGLWGGGCSGRTAWQRHQLKCSERREPAEDAQAWLVLITTPRLGYPQTRLPLLTGSPGGPMAPG